VAEVNTQLQRLMDVGNQRLQELRRFNEDAYKAVMWLRSNKESFRGVIHEPMMLSVCTLSCSDLREFMNRGTHALIFFLVQVALSTI